ncbi:hypothetical protein Ahy_A01g003470 isoform A [Arachis hypogaea]|uniref:SWIM-type domain-containing protein n=1 Tax=Arachis hypogaea TaxID=3818 RepID=A0A445ET17_ARAHY|nr:hypothetical protein Ahy_A01g003470 isoform A [Arachis hypogaea]
MHYRKREPKIVTRCRCLAEMLIKPRDSTGKWYVSSFVDNHNHDLLPAKFVEYLPSHRKISDVDIAHMDSMRQVGISIPKIYESIAAQVGGYNRVSFTKRDMYNKVRWHRALQHGDVNVVLKWSVCVTIVECIEADDICVYVTQKYRRPDRTWNVTQNSSQDTFHCTCLGMESFGFPCVHIISVLVQLDIASLPNSLVLPRWSNIARMDMCRDRVCNPHIDPEATYRARVGALLQHCKCFAKVACMREEDYKTYCQKVVQETNMLKIKNGLQYQATGTHSVPWEGGVKDPIGIRTKRTGRGNEPVGSRGTKRRRCSTCSILRYRRTRCSNGPTSSRQCGQEQDMHPSTETFEMVILNPFRNDTTFQVS